MHNRRGNSGLVLGRFQKWFIAQFVFYSLVFMIVLNAGVFLCWRILMNEVTQLSSLLSPTLFRVIENSKLHGLLLLALLDGCLLILSFIHALNFSRKIAGPVRALFTHLEKVSAEKYWSPFQLRKDDLFEELPEKLNHAVTLAHEGHDSSRA